LNRDPCALASRKRKTDRKIFLRLRPTFKLPGFAGAGSMCPMKKPLTDEPPGDGPVTWEDVSALWEELKGAARAWLAKEGNAGTVHTTQLLNSALKKLVPKSRDWREVSWENRQHFFADAHQAMRNKLKDYARARNAKKRDAIRVGNFGSEFVNPLAESGVLNLDTLVDAAAANAELAEGVDRALTELDCLYPGQHLADIVQYRCFERLSQEQIGKMLDLKPDAVRKREHRAYGLLSVALKEFYRSEATGEDEL